MSVQDDIIPIDRPGQVVTAVIHQRAGEGCESYCGPLVIGYYPTESASYCEVWIECEGKRVQIPPRYFKAVLRLMRFANAGEPA